MVTKEHIIEKVKVLPNDILIEVDDFIDFLQRKKSNVKYDWNWLSSEGNRVEDSGMSDYLDGLTKYEEMLAKKEILWK